MPIVNLPNGTSLNFPDSMSQDDMRSAIQKNFPDMTTKPSVIKDVKDSAVSSGKRLGRFGENLERSLIGGFSHLANDAGLMSDTTMSNIDEDNTENIGNNIAANRKETYQPQTLPGKVTAAAIGAAPMVVGGIAGGPLGAMSIGAMQGVESGFDAIDNGESLPNAQLHTVGSSLLNTALGGVVSGAGGKIISKLGFSSMVPTAVDSAASYAKRAVQNAVIMPLFKPVGAALDYAADALTDSTDDKTYDAVPGLEDPILGALLAVPHSTLEYVKRNKIPLAPTLLADGSSVLTHADGGLFSSPKAAQSFIDKNKLQNALPTEVTHKLLNPKSPLDKTAGYAVKITANDEATASAASAAAGAAASAASAAAAAGAAADNMAGDEAAAAAGATAAAATAAATAAAAAQKANYDKTTYDKTTSDLNNIRPFNTADHADEIAKNKAAALNDAKTTPGDEVDSVMQAPDLAASIRAADDISGKKVTDTSVQDSDRITTNGSSDIQNMNPEELHKWNQTATPDEIIGKLASISDDKARTDLIDSMTMSDADRQDLHVAVQDTVNNDSQYQRKEAPQVYLTRKGAEFAKIQNNLTGMDIVEAPEGKGYMLYPKETIPTEVERNDAQKRVNDLNLANARIGIKGVVLSNKFDPSFGVAKTLAGVFGFKAHIVSASDQFNGVAHNGNFFLSDNAYRPALEVAGHEVTHLIEGTQYHNKLSEVIADYLHNDAISNRKVREDNMTPKDADGKPKGGGISLEGAKKEVIADINGKMWLDPRFWREMIQRDPNLFRQVAYHFAEVTTKGIEGLRGARVDASMFVKDQEAVMKLMAQTWADHFKSNPEAGNLIKDVPKFSLKDEDGKKLTAVFGSLMRQQGDSPFRYPKSKSDDLKTIANEVSGGNTTVSEVNLMETQNPGETMSRLEIRVPTPEGIDKTMDAFVSKLGDDVWINVAGFKKGSEGALVYSIVGNWAYNNGYRFIGDPAGLSNEALVRRLQNMLSLSLKFGSTDFVEPHQRQIDKLKEFGFKWTEGDDQKNIQSMLNTTYNIFSKMAPELRDVEYNFRTNKFEENGKRFTDEDFIRAANKLHDLSVRGAPGSGTLKIGATIATILRGMGNAPMGESSEVIASSFLWAIHSAGMAEAGGADSRSIGYTSLPDLAEGQHETGLKDTLYSRKEEESKAVKELLNNSRSSLKDSVIDHAKSLFDDIKNSKAIREAGLALIPMSMGDQQAKSTAQKFANALRLGQHEWQNLDGYIATHFNKTQREAMWNAADEQNTLLQQGQPTEGKGLDSLPADQRAVMQGMNDYSKVLFERAKAVGMVEGDGLPFWTPRMAVLVGDDGEYTKPGSGGKSRSSDGVGGNLSTSSPNLKQRKYLTAAETEAAMKSTLGDNAELVRDARTMPLAMARLEQAIAGRELVNQVKDFGRVAGKDIVSTGKEPGFVTIDHPALMTYKPRIDIVDGKPKPVLDMNGDVVMDRVPLFIHPDWEGPLRSVLSREDGAWYRGYMLIKSKAMSAIMVSPLTHNMVIMGRALAYDPLQVLTLRAYFTGNALARDSALVGKAINSGLVFMGGNRSTVMDITDVSRGVGKAGGWGDINESIISKSAEALVNVFSKGSGESVKAKMDAMGEFYHHELLWKQVGALQMYIFNDYSNYLIKKGHPDQAANAIAAHLANRYGGAVARENMGYWTRKALNVLLFSRSFNVGNIGAVKDTVFGLPAGIAAKIYNDVGQVAGDKAMKAAAGKARMGIVADLGMSMLLTAVTASAIKSLLDDESIDDISKGYIRRFSEMGKEIDDHPLNPESYNPYQVLPTNDNEEGKKNRIDIGSNEIGQHSYIRLPTGKVVEDTVGWLTEPFDTFKKKESPIVHSVWQAITDDKGFGKPVRDPEGNVLTNISQSIGHVLKAQIPYDSMMTIYDMTQGVGTNLDTRKTAGFITGFSASEGNQRGPEGALDFAVEDRVKKQQAYAMDDVKRDLKYGKEESAVETLQNIGLTPIEINKIIRNQTSPQGGETLRMIRSFNKHSTEKEQELKERLRNNN